MRESNLRAFSAAAVVCALVLSLASGTALATDGVQQANDYFRSLPGTEVDLSALGLGIVPLEGHPFDPDFSLDTDTVVERKFPVPVGGGIIEIEIVALQLKSVAPVDLTPLGGPFIGVFADLWTTINRGGVVPGIPVYSPLLPSVGQMEIQHGSGEGGSFESCFGDPGDPGSCLFLGIPGGGVYADAIFVFPGGDPNNPLDVILNTPAPRISLHTVGSTWVHEGQPPVGRGGPRGGPFGGLPRNSKVTSIIHNGPHPVEAVLFPINHFKVYDVDDEPTNFPVELEDQFSRQCNAPAVNAGNYCWTNVDCDSAPGAGDGLCGTTNVWTVTADFIDWIANPVNKLPEQNITDFFEHQVWYHLSPNDPVPAITFPIENQFGPQTWHIPANADRWLVNPAEKDALGLPLEEHHYLCYDAVGVAFLPPGIRQLQDQFGVEDFDVLNPRVFCNPVQKTFGANIFPAIDPEEHLACYDIDPKFDLDEPHAFLDQFAGWLLQVRQNELLCVPSTKGLACDDSDLDLICDVIDNCPTVFNPGQVNSDADIYGDLCDPCDFYANTVPLNGGVNPAPNADPNGDGIPNECQCGDTSQGIGFLTGADSLAQLQCGANPAACVQGPPVVALWDANGDGFLTGADSLSTLQNGAATTEYKTRCARRPGRCALALGTSCLVDATCGALGPCLGQPGNGG